ncbi:hypothetical protein [Streptomyces violascens]|uniref:hypothetical protein n=1 Tax=Streptomyces violascens TaxID=67381 RepID=UPI001679B252|nr:hypothetical protein [Streptomyces violascens]GGU30424.1 hypothetical protein GCM10010289_59820 [Streptomyces violascens]
MFATNKVVTNAFASATLDGEPVGRLPADGGAVVFSSIPTEGNVEAYAPYSPARRRRRPRIGQSFPITAAHLPLAALRGRGRRWSAAVTAVVAVLVALATNLTLTATAAYAVNEDGSSPFATCNMHGSETAHGGGRRSSRWPRPTRW